MFHTVRPRDKNDCKMNGCYKSYIQKVPSYNVKSIALSNWYPLI